MNTTASGSGARQNPFDEHVELFLSHLRFAGYAERTLRKKLTALRRLAQSAQQKGIWLPISVRIAASAPRDQFS